MIQVNQLDLILWTHYWSEASQIKVSPTYKHDIEVGTLLQSQGALWVVSVQYEATVTQQGERKMEV
jgi:hypothetical protein